MIKNELGFRQYSKKNSFLGKCRVSFIFLLILPWLFRSFIFNRLVSYSSIGTRNIFRVNDENLTEYLTFRNRKADNIGYLINSSLSSTSNKLSYSVTKNVNDPNKLFFSGNAHCGGNASFFSSACSFLIEKGGLSEKSQVLSQIGQLYIFGIYIQKHLDTHFLKEHDFVTIENIETGEVFAVEPTIYDYLGISYVKLRK